MVRRCSVLGCQNSTGLHSFPEDFEIRRQWLRVIGIELCELRPRAGVCNEHFTRDSFSNLAEFEMGFSKQLRLKSKAVPSLALPGRRLQVRQVHHLQPKATREIGCQTEPVIRKSEGVQANLKPAWRSKAIQARAPNRSVSCDTETLMEHSLLESFRSTLKRKRCELSEKDSSNHLDGSQSPVNCTSTSGEVSPNNEKKYVIHEDQLLELFLRCPVCTRSCTVQKTTIGTLQRVSQLCRHCEYSNEWSSQPTVDNIPAANLKLCAAVLFSSLLDQI